MKFHFHITNNWQYYCHWSIFKPNTEDNTLKLVKILVKLTWDYNLPILTQKLKVMAIRGPDSIRSKIVINNNILVGINHLKYLGNMNSNTNELKVNYKIKFT